MNKITNTKEMKAGHLYCAFRTVEDASGEVYDRGDELLWCGVGGTLYTEDGDEWETSPMYLADGTCVSEGFDYPDFFVEQTGSFNSDYAG